MEEIGKWVHHRCGYRLWAHVLDRFADGAVVVMFRDPACGSPPGLWISMCPQCLQALQLWWHDPEGGGAGGSAAGAES